MNEILQKRIEEAAEKIVCSVQCAYFDLDKTCCCYEKKFCMKTAEEVLQNQWISVEEALPEIKEHFVSEDVLCKYSDGSMGFDYLKENMFGQQWFEHECEESVVTHWMMIPTINNEEK